MTDQVDLNVELDEEIDEALDLANAEDQSVASVKKGEAAGKKAKARKGDKKVKDEPADQGVPAKAPQQESLDISDFSEDLDALVNDEATLSEDFKAKTAVIFEAAVKSKLAEEVDRLEEAYAAELTEATALLSEEMVGKVDSYLNYVVENWMEENKLAVQSGLRAEIAEGFMGKLKDLFVESYVDVPESKVDLVDELATAYEELEESANEAIAKSIELGEEVQGLQRAAIIRESSKDLAETQVEKLEALTADIDFVSEEAFTAKVATLKESYFSAKASTPTPMIEEDADEAAGIVETTDTMAQYLKAIRKSST